MAREQGGSLTGVWRQAGTDIPVAIVQEGEVCILTNYKGKVAVGLMKQRKLEILPESAWGAGFTADFSAVMGKQVLDWANGAQWTRLVTEPED